MSPQIGRDEIFMPGVGIGIDERYGDSLDVERHDIFGKGSERRLIGRNQNRAIRREAFTQLEPQLARNQRFVPMVMKIKGKRTIPPSRIKDFTKSLGRYQSGTRTISLDVGVDDQCGAEFHEIGNAEIYLRLVNCVGNA